jgi:class 3 adenylate cyclase
MKNSLPDPYLFERQIFVKANPLDLLLTFCLKLMQARQVGLLFGTDKTGLKYLSPEKWDRGKMHKFKGSGWEGFILKYFGTFLVRVKGLSPVRLYRESHMGERMDKEGIIPFVLRTHKNFYKNGLNIIIIKDTRYNLDRSQEVFARVAVHAYNGKEFRMMPDLKINTAIVNQFRSENFISAYIPDYGAIVFNTVDPMLFETEAGGFDKNDALKKRLDILITAIEMASLANIGLARGRQAAQIIWRKEKNLRKTALELEKKEGELNAQKAYLRAVGAVNERQLNMEAVNINDGVYAFLDMVGSAVIRKPFRPRDYLYILNLCFQIAADNANRFFCRVDNFIGDCVFLQSTSVFDNEEHSYFMRLEERCMLMIMAIASILNEIEQLKNGEHELDPDARVKEMIDKSGVKIDFRAGVEIGPAMVGPLGSQKRKIVTAIGKAVNNASRLESSGVPSKIHVSKEVMDLLNEAYITRDTEIIGKTLGLGGNSVDMDTVQKDHCAFWDTYRTVFNIRDALVQERNNVSFKEFSKKVSYLICSM